MQNSMNREYLLRAQTFGTRATYKGGMVFVKPLRRQSRVEANKETAVEVNKVSPGRKLHLVLRFNLIPHFHFGALVIFQWRCLMN